MTHEWNKALALLAAVTLAGCGGDGAITATTGKLDLAVTDAPVDGARRVVVEFTGIELQPASGNRIDIDYAAPRQIDLLALSGSDSELLLDDVEVRAGAYSWVRLKVNSSRTETDSFIELDDGSIHPLFIPSGAESGLKLNGGVVVPAGGAASFTVDFDLRKSVHEPQNPGEDAYVLRPTLRLVDNSQVGAIAGIVDAALAGAVDCEPVVYVFAAGAAADDVDGAEPEPVTTARVLLNTASGDYEYRAGFLLVGTYGLSFTCDAGLDDPAADDTLAFSALKPATVSIGATATVDFP